MIRIPAKLYCDARGCSNRTDMELELRIRDMQLGTYEVESVPGSVRIFDGEIPSDWVDDYGQHFCPEHKEPWTR
jgi:hypothetical protein